MLILAFDTSGFAGSVALLDSARILAERMLDPKRRSAQTLAPAMAGILAEAGARPADVRLTATTIGPGSFTGLRIGVTAAKTFAYAAGCDVIGLSTLEVIAAQVPERRTATIHAILDAQRKELFLATYQISSSGGVTKGDSLPQLHRLAPDRIIAADAWLAELAPGTIVTGSGVDRLIDRLPTGTIVVEPSLREPQAATVGRLAWQAFQAGRRDDLWKLAPAYLRPSAAEEKAP